MLGFSNKKTAILLAVALTTAAGVFGLTVGGLRLVRAVGQKPVISPIPDQSIAYDASFAAISLDDYVADPDTGDKDIAWTVTGNSNISVAISGTRVATLTYTAGWSGTENLTFKATDPEGNSASDLATFTVAANELPVVGILPKPVVPLGATFASINLDDYVADPDHADSQITWATSSPSGSKFPWIAITNRVATVTYPSNWTGTGSFFLTATDPAGASDSEEIILEVRRVLTVSAVTANTATLTYAKNISNVQSWQVQRDSEKQLDAQAAATADYVDQDLADNTSYTYEVQLEYQDSSLSGYLSTTTTTTLAAAPTALGAEAGREAISLTATRFTNDTVGSSAYRFDNVTTGATSGWTSATTWESSGLACGTSYDVRITYRSSAGVPTDPFTETVETSACPEPARSLGAPLPIVGSPGGPPPEEFPKLEAQPLKQPVSEPTEKGDSVVPATAGKPNAGASLPATSAVNVTVTKIQEVFRELIVDGDLHPAGSASTPPPPEPKLNTSQLATLPPVVKETSSAAPANVAAIQQRLESYGVATLPTEPAVTLDQAMRQAVREFQRSAGINPVGVVGPRTAKALNGEEFISNASHTFVHNMSYGARSEEVRQLQIRLQDQAFFPHDVPTTGWYGPITRAAVTAFQTLYGLPVTGALDAATRVALNVFSR